MRRLNLFPVGEGAIRTLVAIVRVTVLVNLLMLASELFTAFYTGGAHVAAARYLFFGDHGAYGLVPWMWTSVTCNIAAALAFLNPRVLERKGWLVAGCVLAFVGIWIEKGMGLIVPGFIPSTLHEIVEYAPSVTEWKITAGIWSLGLLIFSAALKVACPVLSGSIRESATVPGASQLLPGRHV